MKLREIFRYEFNYQISRIWPWIIFCLIGIVTFLFTRDGALSDVQYSEFYLNSSYLIVSVSVVGGMLWLLTGAVITGDAAARDVASGIHPIAYTSSVKEWEYITGRYLAVLTVHLILLLAIPIGNLLAVYLPGVPPALVGPFRPEFYLTAFFIISVPNMLVAVSLQFYLALKSGKPMAAYMGSLILFFMAYVLSSILFFKGRKDLANLFDPVGVHFILSEISHLWTNAEKNTRVLALEGNILANRFLWLSVAVASTAMAYITFRFRHRTVGNWKKYFTIVTGKRSKQEIGMVPVFDPSTYIKVPEVVRDFKFDFRLQQLKAITWKSFLTAANSWAGRVFLILLPILTFVTVQNQMQFNQVELIPTTGRILKELSSSPGMDKWVLVPLILIFLSGELIWKEREAGTEEISDSMPGSSWLPLLGKFLGISLLVVCFIVLQMGAGILIQVMDGYNQFEFGHYVAVMFGLQLIEYLLFLVLAMAIHVVVNQKYLGHLVAIFVLMIVNMPWLFGIRHSLLLYGAGPDWSYTEMKGFAGSITPWLWFKLYWISWALILLVVARLFWVRGKGKTLRTRLANLHVTTSAKYLGIVAAVFLLITGGYAFYNTNILNSYASIADAEQESADYENLYGKFKNDGQPMLTNADLKIELYQEKHMAEINGTYTLTNQTNNAIPVIHVAVSPQVETGNISFDRSFKNTVKDDKLGHYSFELDQPLQAKDSVKLSFSVIKQPKGFTIRGVARAVVENGTYFNNDVLPKIGYQADRELVIPGRRRLFNLPERPVVTSLYNSEVWQNRDAGLDFKTGVTLKTTIGTGKGQVAVAPGNLEKSWAENGRHYYRFQTNAPIGDQWDFFSAEYAVMKKEWTDPGSGKKVAVRIYHHPEHDDAPKRLAAGVEAALDYYSKHFGPYEYNHLTIVERAGSGIGMHAEASLINYSEGSALFKPVDTKRTLDLPYMIITHEMAHQWTVPYAFVEGAPVMTESIAWYYGLKAIEESLGETQLEKMRAFMRRPYPYTPIRRGEPLLRGLDPYQAYRKGPFALYALSEYVGEPEINQALRKLLETHNKPGAPLATTLDLYKYLNEVTPDSSKYLLHDLFEVNTFWDFEVEKATAVRKKDDLWEVTLQFQANKEVYDSAGVQKNLPMNEWIEVGIFGNTNKWQGELDKPLYLQKHKLKSGRQTLTITVKGKPGLAGVDPFHILDWEEKEDDNNIESVSIQKE